MKLYERTSEQVARELCAFCGEAHALDCEAAREWKRRMRRLARSLKAKQLRTRS